MYLYVELWKARPAWLALGKDEREQFFGTVGREIGDQIGAGCELVAVARNDTDTPRRAPYDFLAVWRIPDRERVDAFAAAWERLGFHGFFEQSEARLGGDPRCLRGRDDRAVAGARFAAAC